MGRASRHKRERPPVRTVYHFTAHGHLASILAEGQIRTTDSQVDPIRCAWFLDTPTTEDLDHGLQASIWDKTAVRITVRARAVRWLDWVAGLDQRRKVMGIPLPQWLDSVVKTGGGPEAAAHWWVTFDPVPVKQGDVDVRNEAGEYVPLVPKEAYRA